MKASLCIPRFRTTAAAGRKNRRITPMSLLDRLREALFRLIMLSALSKATEENESGDYHRAASCYYPPEPHHSEAVADCIEFIRKSATAEDARDSTASSSSSAVDAANEVIFPVPVL